MREELKKCEGMRSEYSAAFLRYGWRRGYHNVRTALFIDIRDKRGSLVTDHQWIVVGHQIRDLDLKPYERVRFMASPAPYLKGRIDHTPGPHVGKQLDYRLKNYSGMRRVSGDGEPQGRLFESQVEAS